MMATASARILRREGYMPPTRQDFERMFKQSIGQLAAAIKGRETLDQWLKPEAAYPQEAALHLLKMPVNTSDGMFDFQFILHADCPCVAIKEFLDKAMLDNVTFAEGPRGGKVLGIDGQAIKSFYAYKK